MLQIDQKEIDLNLIVISGHNFHNFLLNLLEVKNVCKLVEKLRVN